MGKEFGDWLSIVINDQYSQISASLPLPPLAEIVCFAEVAGEPVDFTVIPVVAVKKVYCSLLIGVPTGKFRGFTVI